MLRLIPIMAKSVEQRQREFRQPLRERAVTKNSKERIKSEMSTPVDPWLSYSPLDPRFMGLNPAGDDGFF